jgi:hypothetical protein
MLEFSFPSRGLHWAPLSLRRLTARWWAQRTPLRAGVTVFSADPPILLVADWFLHGVQLDELVPVREWLADRKALFIVMPMWDITNPKYGEKIARQHETDRRRYPLHRTIQCIVSPESEALCAKRGVETLMLHPNAFVDENLFRPLEGITKEFDTVYDAQIVPYKRHDLATQIENLCLVAYIISSTHNRDYVEMIHRLLPDATWANDPRLSGHRKLTLEEVNVFLNRSRTGLCLSGVEGGMFASIQYLLAGLPVVSTPSKGGRDAFFDPVFTRIVEPNAKAVADGVREMAAKGLDPHPIREATLRRVREYRARFRAVAETFAKECGRPFDFDAAWRSRFVSGIMTGPVPVKEILAQLPGT